LGENTNGERKGEMEEEDLCVELSKDATFFDLYEAIDAIEEKEGLDSLHFEEELWDNFDEELFEEVLALRSLENETRAQNTKVIDFFKKRGFSKEDIEIYLPIKFSA